MKRILWNDNWKFSKDKIMIPKEVRDITGQWEELDLPHTWNGIDGQDGGNDYHRGNCYYVKILKKSDLSEERNIYLEFNGVNSSAIVYVNGTEAGAHHGGYSTWRINITDLLKDENIIVVMVDNAANDFVYPQMADFTFYGGIYREVNIVCVDDARFNLDYYGGPGIAVTPKVIGNNAIVDIEVYLTGDNSNNKLKYTIFDNDKIIGEKEVLASTTKVSFDIENVHLWNGKKDPYLYSVNVQLLDNSKVIDYRSSKFGCRFFEIHPEKGFILNGESYPLRGVSRHQDYPKKGNALTKGDHEKDIDLICEIGATTVRLAHYQHDQYFYDLCDEKGLVIWAEIPYISKHMPRGKDNTISQMRELIVQNYNHASIFVWGLSNEISIGANDDTLVDNHNELNRICHEMDKTRLTTVAVVSPCKIDDPYVHISDIVSYNHYYGWYGGDVSMNGPWFDNFHEKYPNKPIGLSEYGCEALDWHTSNPEQGDYTEEYQAYYHEELIKQLFTRPYIWATHVWNMFDFAADGRAEGGENGMNHKGLITFDREYKKDAFYAYKAWLSDEKFVHICGKRYIDRVEDITKITVYSNELEVEMFVNGKSIGKQESDFHFFYFNVPNIGESTISVKTASCTDESKIKKVKEFNEAYRMKEEGDVINWFDIETPEGFFNINDKIGDIMLKDEGKRFFIDLMKGLMPGAVDQMAATANEGTMNMMNSFTVKRFINLVGSMAPKKPTKEDLLEINKKLNTIKK